MFKQLKPDDNVLKFYIFVRQIKKSGFVPGDCIETFVAQKKIKALSELYSDDDLELLEQKLAEAKKKRESSGLVLQYKDDVPQNIRNIVAAIAQETNLCGNIIVSLTDKETGVARRDDSLAGTLTTGFNNNFKENGDSFKNSYYLFLNKKEFIIDQCNQLKHATLRHEFKHIEGDDGSVEKFYYILNKKRKNESLLRPTIEQVQKISRSLETQADLMPLAYAPLSIVCDHEKFWNERNRRYTIIYNNGLEILKNINDCSQPVYTMTIGELKKMVNEKSLEDILKEKNQHPSRLKRLQRATVIRRIKEAELFYDDPFGYIDNTIHTYLAEYKYLQALIVGLKNFFGVFLGSVSKLKKCCKKEYLNVMNY